MAVDRYAKILRNYPSFEFPPILVSGGKFLDGGHRLAAYELAGRAMIPVVEVGNITNATQETWERWIEGDTSVRFERAD